MFSHLLVVLLAFLVLTVSPRPHPRATMPTVTPSSMSFTTATSVTDDCSGPTSSSMASVPPTPVLPPSSSATLSTSVSPSARPVDILDMNNGPFSGGFATYFYQDGNPGACGQVHSDSDYICAMDQARFGADGYDSSLCGQQVQITNVNTGQSITVTIADDCPTCENENSIDLSVAAFQSLAPLSEGVFPIQWNYVS